jgi:lipopolysaccharide exporter
VVSLVLAAVCVAATVRISLEAVALAFLGQMVITWAIGAYAVKKSVGFPMRRQVTAGATSMAATLVMALTVWVAMRALPETIVGPVQLLVLVLAGTVSYAVAMATFAPALAVKLARVSMMVAKGRRQEAVALIKGGS